MGYELKLSYVSGSISLTKAVNFCFKKERFTPYTEFSGVFIGKCSARSVTEVIFTYDEKTIHCGSADSVECELKNGQWMTKIRSFGFTMLLGQNQSEPGIITAPSLDTIMSKNLPIYKVSWQTTTNKVNYVYINERTSIWDALCVYGMKAYGSFPYISGTNTVRCTPQAEKTHVYSGEKIVAYSQGERTANLISHAYTTDTDGNWSISNTNSFAVSRHITKQKYYARDKEWLYDLNTGLSYRIYFADRGRQYIKFSYAGYKGEDIMDKATAVIEGMSLNKAEIDRVTVTGNEKGIFTEIMTYQ